MQKTRVQNFTCQTVIVCYKIEVKIIKVHVTYIMSSLKTFEQTVNHFSLVSMLQQRALGNFKR